MQNFPHVYPNTQLTATICNYFRVCSFLCFYEWLLASLIRTKNGI